MYIVKFKYWSNNWVEFGPDFPCETLEEAKSVASATFSLKMYQSKDGFWYTNGCDAYVVEVNGETETVVYTLLAEKTSDYDDSNSI